MHPKNPYNNPPDFKGLSEIYPALKPYLVHTTSGTTIDFQDPDAQRCLTETLLHCEFGLTLVVPKDRLCPPVPNRLNYVLWLHDIFTYILGHCPEKLENTQTVLDIGTGASAIYPLLGCSVESRWRFIATDIDTKSIEYATENVKSNNLQDRITILKVDSGGNVLPVDAEDDLMGTGTTFNFTMCNPPFYSSRQEVLESAEAKELDPNAVCTGADNEMITPGGEVAFVRRMIRESLLLWDKCLWYTSMLGKMSSLVDIVEVLRAEKVNNYAITEFMQGRTRRWAIAWSFVDIHLPDSLARISNATLQGIQPSRNTLRQLYTRSITQELFARVVRDVLDAIDGVDVHASGGASTDAALLRASATADTWSRAARRRKVKAPGDTVSEQPAQLICGVRVRGAGKDESAMLEFQWVKGTDRNLFESFMSHVGRKVGEKVDRLGASPSLYSS